MELLAQQTPTVYMELKQQHHTFIVTLMYVHVDLVLLGTVLLYPVNVWPIKMWLVRGHQLNVVCFSEEFLFLNFFKFISYCLKVGSNGYSCSVTADCITLTNFACNSGLCSCSLPYVWNSTSFSCVCIAPYYAASPTSCGRFPYYLCIEN